VLELAAITCDGAQGAEPQLAELRAAGNEAWLADVSIIEHDAEGRYSVEAENPSVGDKHAGKGAACGALAGVGWTDLDSCGGVTIDASIVPAQAPKEAG